MIFKYLKKKVEHTVEHPKTRVTIVNERFLRLF